ncbi:ubiquitin ligase protein FANCL, putative [Pediculus humanus corporis]|uniref:Ubiquitin ligase protein FANCL, putative n=1 Tax=Pediculus humanus subsp. corporis TaxID=121224 RepID=E0VDJ2_PEDHC|nr:ubiquitin ligase protein FANCL, putative [Pediculus humanus corporis]EEB11448.1 ubiquitin ligase protein FANCL, putative [Pediculus humanus corporis]
MKYLGPSLKNFLQRKFSSVNEFYIELKKFVAINDKNRITHKSLLEDPLKMCNFVSVLQKDLNSVRELLKLVNLEKNLLTMEVVDSQNRVHKAIIKLSNCKEPITVVNHDLPLKKANSEIRKFCEKFINLIKSLQEFWDLVTLIDSSCIVIEPYNPTLKDNFRRIKLSETFSVSFTIDPENPNVMPNFQFYGCQSEINHHKEILQNSIINDKWDQNENLLKNISKILCTKIPNKMSSDNNDLCKLVRDGECAICFTTLLENELPNEVCESHKCKSLYHSKCLKTYLCSLPNVRESFGKIIGLCPNCDNVIFCSL